MCSHSNLSLVQGLSLSFCWECSALWPSWLQWDMMGWVHNPSECPHTPVCPVPAYPTFSLPCWANCASLAQVEVPGLVPTSIKI